MNVYALVDLRQPATFKYIGGTTRSIPNRFKDYCQPRLTCSQKLAAWITHVRANGSDIQIVALESVNTVFEMLTAEQQWIAWARLFGPILNREKGSFNGTNKYGKPFPRHWSDNWSNRGRSRKRQASIKPPTTLQCGKYFFTLPGGGA